MEQGAGFAKHYGNSAAALVQKDVPRANAVPHRAQ